MNATSQRLGGAAPASTYRDHECEVRLYRPSSSIFATHVTGHLSAAGGRAIAEFGSAIFAHGISITMFHEWLGMTSYDSEARTHLTKWVLTHHALIYDMTFVVESRLVAMGIATANLATRAAGVTLRTVPDRQAFDDALEQALRAQVA